MKKPKMLLFDYGHTLAYEPHHSATNGNKEIFKYIKNNPNHVSFEEFDKTIQDLWKRIKEIKGNAEVHEHQFINMWQQYMGIELSVSIQEAEEIIWNGISAGDKMPYVTELLEFLDREGIRTGVVSNICFSGDALKARINRMLPNNKFEFIVASSECVFRKPNRLIFELALKKAELRAEQVWYCGDSIEHDVYGAYNAGLFPVLYDGDTEEMDDPMKKINDGLKVGEEIEHLYVRDWRELIDKLKKM